MKVEYLWAAWGLPDPPPTGYPRPFLAVPSNWNRSEFWRVAQSLYRNKSLIAVYVTKTTREDEYFAEYRGRVGQFIRLDHIGEKRPSDFAYSVDGSSWGSGWPVRVEKAFAPDEAPLLEDLCRASGVGLASLRGQLHSKALVKLKPALAQELQAVFDGEASGPCSMRHGRHLKRMSRIGISFPSP